MSDEMSDLDVVDEPLEPARLVWEPTHEVHLLAVDGRRHRVRTFRCDVADAPAVRQHVQHVLQDNPGFKVEKVLIDLNS